MSAPTKAPTVPETATEALLRMLGVSVPIEVVDPRKAFRQPPTEPVVRVAQIGESWVTSAVGGPYGRTGNLLAATVRAGGYGAPRSSFASVLVNRGRVHVDERFRQLSADVDLIELDVQPGPGGKVGRLDAWSVTLTPGILSAAPPLAPGLDLALRELAVSVRGKIEWIMPGSGGQGIAAEVVARVLDPSVPDEDGLVNLKVALDVTANPTGRAVELAYVHQRVVAVLEGLRGQAHVGVGRVVDVEVDVAPPGGRPEVQAAAVLSVRAWDAPKGVRR